MEVHHHAHSERKKWTHYFWEFFMLFLAVTLGFFVENQREHFVEHRREKQYMQSLVEDLQKDIFDLNTDIWFWNLQFERIDTIRMEIKKPEEKRNKQLLYKNAAYMRWYNKFLYHDRTIAQLKNGGNFRLIRNKGIADSLMEYDASVNYTIRDIEAISNNLWQNLNNLQSKLFSSEYYSQPFRDFNLDSAVNVNPQQIEIRKGKEDELFEYYNLLDYFRGLNMTRNAQHEILLRQAGNLVTIIKKKYRLK